MYETVKKHINTSLARYLRQVKKKYNLHLVSPLLFEGIKDFTLRDGKRIRPLLLILCYKGYLPRSRKLAPSFYHAAACIEFLHNFMLIHDDIIDRSDLRRGKPTLHRLLASVEKTNNKEKLGFDLSIIAGDIIYALAIDAFLSIKVPLDRKEKALKHFIKTAAFTAMGEFIDTVQGVSDIKKIKEEDVFLNYTLKTARYTFECPLVVGAILAGAPEREIKQLSRLGILIGQAFQIQDDIIGIFESEKNIGKSILTDLAESKKTLLVCHAFHTLKGKDRQQFLKYFLKTKSSYADLVAIRRIFIRAGSLSYSLDAINRRLEQAQKIFQKLKMNKKILKEITSALTRLFQHSQRLSEKNPSKSLPHQINREEISSKTTRPLSVA